MGSSQARSEVDVGSPPPQLRAASSATFRAVSIPSSRGSRTPPPRDEDIAREAAPSQVEPTAAQALGRAGPRGAQAPQPPVDAWAEPCDDLEPGTAGDLCCSAEARCNGLEAGVEEPQALGVVWGAALALQWGPGPTSCLIVLSRHRLEL